MGILATHYADRGDLDRARMLYQRLRPWAPIKETEIIHRYYGGVYSFLL
jgi:hypothetical protein